MRNLSEMQRVIYRHDWLCVAEWASAVDELADLTDDQIDGLARNDQKDAFSAYNGISLPSGSEPQASRGDVRPWLRWRPCVATVGRDDHLPDAAPFRIAGCAVIASLLARQKLLQIVEASLIKVAQGLHHVRFRRTQGLEVGRPLNGRGSALGAHGDGRPIVR